MFHTAECQISPFAFLTEMEDEFTDENELLTEDDYPFDDAFDEDVAKGMLRPSKFIP